MFPSVDTLHLVRTYKAIPSPEELSERQWTSKVGGKLNKTGWYNNGMREISEPNLFIYQTFDDFYKLSAKTEIPKLIYDSNINLPDEADINQAMQIISNNVAQRSNLLFDAWSANVRRIDYSMNLRLEPNKLKRFIAHYQKFEIAKMLRKTIADQTVYFENNSRNIRIYDKYAEVKAKNPKDFDLHKLAKNLVRIEYYFLSEKAVRRFAERLGFKDHTATSMLLPNNINTVFDELKEFLQLDASLDFTDETTAQRVYRLTGDAKKAITLSGFKNAINDFGENFHEIEGMNYSQSTYRRNKRECQKLGL